MPPQRFIDECLNRTFDTTSVADSPRELAKPA
jgi:hypothetical protein